MTTHRAFLAAVVFVATACTGSPDSRVELDLTALHQHAAQGDTILASLFVRAERLFDAKGNPTSDAPVVAPVEPGQLTFEMVVPTGRTRFVLEAFRAVNDAEFTAVPAYLGEVTDDLNTERLTLILPAQPVGTVRARLVPVGAPPVPDPFIIGFDPVVPDRNRVDLAVSGTTAATVMRAGTYAVEASLSGADAVFLPSVTVAAGDLIDRSFFLVAPGAKCLAAAPDEVKQTSPPCRSINVQVSGVLGTGMSLELNGGSPLAVGQDGSYTFGDGLEDGQPYAVTVAQRPVGPRQNCSVTDATGTASSTSPIVVVTCDPTPLYAISGVVHDYSGSGLQITLDTMVAPPEVLDVPANSSFAFQTWLPDQASWMVIVSRQPSVSGGVDPLCATNAVEGSINTADVSDVEIFCVGEVLPMYANSGADWNDYVVNDGPDDLSATDTPCAGTEVGDAYACLHGAELRQVELPGVPDCSEIFSVSDSQGWFEWACDDSGPVVRVYTLGMFQGVGLADMIDFTTRQWRFAELFIGLDRASLLTPSTVWWNNVVVDNDAGGPLDTAGRVYTVGSALMPGTTFTATADRVALVADPAFPMTVNEDSRVFSATARNFIWFEGAVEVVDTMGAGVATVRLANTNQSVLHDVRIAPQMPMMQLTGTGISLVNSSKNCLHELVVEYQDVGLDLTGTSTGNVVYNGRMRENTNAGVRVSDTAHRTTLDDVYATSSSFGVGIELSADDCSLREILVSDNFNEGLLINASGSGRRGLMVNGIRAFANGTYGIFAQDLADSMFNNVNVFGNTTGSHWARVTHSVMTHATFVSNNGNVELVDSDNNTLANILSVGADMASAGLTVTTSDNNTFHDIAAASNYRGIEMTNNTGNAFHGELMLGDNMTALCSITMSDALVDATCANNGGSTANLVSTHFGSTAFSGLDVSDGGNSNGVTLDAASITDWENFENPYRGWALDGASPPFPGPCNLSNLCSFWDSRMFVAATFPTFATPTGNDALVHGWSATAADQSACDNLIPGSTFAGGSCETRFLMHAHEYTDPFAPAPTGNRNGLCESGEHCGVSSNPGVYQGDFTVEAPDIGTGGVIENVDLKTYNAARTPPGA